METTKSLNVSRVDHCDYPKDRIYRVNRNELRVRAC